MDGLPSRRRESDKIRLLFDCRIQFQDITASQSGAGHDTPFAPPHPVVYLITLGAEFRKCSEILQISGSPRVREWMLRLENPIYGNDSRHGNGRILNTASQKKGGFSKYSPFAVDRLQTHRLSRYTLFFCRFHQSTSLLLAQGLSELQCVFSVDEKDLMLCKNLKTPLRQSFAFKASHLERAHGYHFLKGVSSLVYRECIFLTENWVCSMEATRSTSSASPCTLISHFLKSGAIPISACPALVF